MYRLLAWIALASGSFTSSCATTPQGPPPSFVKTATWQGADKDAVYQACIQALHFNGHELHPQLTTKESGLVVTMDREFYPFSHFKLVKASYRLNILVLESDANASINVQVKAKWWKVDPGAWGFSAAEVKHLVAQKVSTDMNEVIPMIDQVLGTTSARSLGVLAWE